MQFEALSAAFPRIFRARLNCMRALSYARFHRSLANAVGPISSCANRARRRETIPPRSPLSFETQVRRIVPPAAG